MKDTLGEVDKQEKLGKLSKFFGATPEKIERSQKIEAKAKAKKDNKHKLKEWKKAAKEWENKYIETKKLLSRVEMQNADLQREVWELKQKLKHHGIA